MRRAGIGRGSLPAVEGILAWFHVLLRALVAFCLPTLLALAGTAPRKVVVGINRDYPPYEYLDASGRPAGYDVDLLRALAEVEDLQLEFRADTWDGTLQAFRSGRLDMLAGMLHSQAREAFADFSTPHLVVHYSIFVRHGDRGIGGESDLPGHRVLVERGSQMDDHLRASGLGAFLEPVDSEPEALRRLAAGQGDAAVAPQLEGLVLAKQDHLPIQSVGGPLFTRQLCFATRKGDAELLFRLNTGLAILNQTGRYAELYQGWFGHLEPDPREGRALARRALAILGIVAAALILVAIWNRSLRRQVTQATARLHQANQEIRDREAHLDAVIQNLPVAIFGKDPRRNYEFTLWNARSEQIFGFGKAEVLGRSDHDLFPMRQAAFFRAKDEEVVRSGRILDIPEERVLSRSLGEIILHTRKVPLFDATGTPILLLGISEDITDQRTMEEALRQAQKLESLGVLAGGIAHDFNNLLTAILGNLGLAGLHAPEGHPARPFLRSAEATTLRAAELTRQMLAYSGKGVFEVRPVDLNQAAGEMASLLKVSISKKVALRFQFAEGLPAIEADAAQLQQVVMNLVTNASEAIGEEEGEILLATGRAELDAAQAAALHPGSPIPPGPYVFLRVEDSGAGMTPEVLSRIFDPFFTTKFSGRGLGLSAMLGILRAHHAGIGIRTEPGRGTEFSLYFPESYPVAPPAAAPSGSPPPLRGRGTILIADDEPEVRATTAAVLREAGFEVLEAADGQEAVELWQRGAERIRAVLMDLTMPRMDGRSAAQAILAVDPRVRILLTSGFPADSEPRLAAGAELAGFLPKPYQSKDLLAALQRALEPS
ncbi:MAG TPA: transporter substrate-binding domain-containing protein [Holophagaceae bacterium]